MPQRSVATNFTFEQQRQEINLLAADFWTQKGTVDTAASTYLKHDGSNDFTGQTLAVPAAFTINSNSGNGTVTISGNLDVTGTTTTVSSANLEVTDKNILIAKGSTSDSQADGAGITIDSATDITFNFVDAKDALVSSIGLEGTTFLKAPYGQFTGSGTATGGQGVEINAPDTNTGQIISYDRANTAYKELRVKGSSVGIYGGTSNALVGTFNSTGLVVTPLVTTTDVILNGVGDTALRWAVAGTASANWDWSIYNATSGGNSTALKVFDNANNSTRAVFNANAGVELNYQSTKRLETTSTGASVNGGITVSGDINLVDNGTLYGGSTAANVLKLTSCSGNVNHSRIEVGTSEGSDNGGIHFYTAGSSSATRRITIKGTSGNVGIGEDSPADRLVVQEAKPSDDVGIRVKNDTTTDGDATNPTTASLYLNTSTGDFNTFYIQARRNDNDTWFGYADPRTVGHVPSMCITNDGNIGVGSTNPSQPLTLKRTSSGQAAFGLRFEYENTVGPTSTSAAVLCDASGLTFKNYNSSRDFIFETGNVEPAADNTQNLGASNKRWANVYSGDVHLNNTGMGGNEVDGSEGNWTMQEGSDDLFLINRNTGKKYKFNLTEVS